MSATKSEQRDWRPLCIVSVVHCTTTCETYPYNVSYEVFSHVVTCCTNVKVQERRRPTTNCSDAGTNDPRNSTNIRDDPSTQYDIKEQTVFLCYELAGRIPIGKTTYAELYACLQKIAPAMCFTTRQAAGIWIAKQQEKLPSELTGREIRLLDLVQEKAVFVFKCDSEKVSAQRGGKKTVTELGNAGEDVLEYLEMVEASVSL
ncbi:unnamed protein product [Amoebophrya sp. A120]|nr:unnamed protein product [Amoebophrya sp. A120]|eukprot:GSA120T00016061001.1